MQVLAVVLILLIACSPARATESFNLLQALNAIRVSGCAGFPGAVEPLIRNPKLDEAAQFWSKGGRLEAALRRTQYRARASASKHVGGADNADEVAVILQAEYCEALSNPAYSQVGLFAAPKRVWLVLAAPLESVSNEQDVARQVLDEVNAARRTARHCGSTAYPPAPPLSFESKLERAALRHVLEMAEHDRVRHEDTNGGTVADRVKAFGYEWMLIGENIASGASTPSEVVRAWLASPGHCANIMNARFTSMGVAFAVNEQARARIFWVQVLATPR